MRFRYLAVGLIAVVWGLGWVWYAFIVAAGTAPVREVLLYPARYSSPSVIRLVFAAFGMFAVGVIALIASCCPEPESRDEPE